MTTFRPKSGQLLERINDIVGQVGYLVVIDDTGKPELTLELPESAGWSRLINGTNKGIAWSLNRGVSLARSKGFSWVLSLDDDTQVDKTYVERLIQFLDKHPAYDGKIGAIALARRGNRTRAAPDGGEYREKRTLVTSGCLSPISVMERVDGYDSSFFIDLVDFDFCTRLRQIGMSIVEVLDVGMDHRVGDLRTRNMCGFTVNVYNHAPFRLYYQVRNAVLFFGKFVAYDPLLSLLILLDVVKVPLKAALFEENKKTRLMYSLLGFRDGILRRTGRVPVRR